MSCQMNANNDNVNELMEITGLPRDEAARLLEITDFNLGLAVTYYLESTEDKNDMDGENISSRNQQKISNDDVNDDNDNEDDDEKDENYSDDSVDNLRNKKRTGSMKKRKRKDNSTFTTNSIINSTKKLPNTGASTSAASTAMNHTNSTDSFSYRKRRRINTNSNINNNANKSTNLLHSAQTAVNNNNNMNSIPSTSSQAIKNRLLNEINPDEENIRAPIPPKREQLVKPEEDIFRDIAGHYSRNTAHGNNRNLTNIGGIGSLNSNTTNTSNNNRKRRQPTFSVCPLRNFAREAEIQEQQLSWLMENNDNMNINADVVNSIINTRRNLSSTTTTNAGNSSNLTNDIIYNNNNNSRTRRNSTLIHGNDSNTNSNNNNNNTNRLIATRSRLEDLFAPPIDLLFWGTFHAARDHATNLNRWLIVNLQDNSEFKSQILNRDIWPDTALKQLIIRHFVLWQVSVDNKEGYRFKTFYHVKDFPYICIIDPRTGEHKISFDVVTSQKFHNELLNFLKEQSFTLEEGSEDDLNNIREGTIATMTETTMPTAASQRNISNSHYSSRAGIPSTSKASISNLLKKDDHSADDDDNDDDESEDEDDDENDDSDTDDVVIKKSNNFSKRDKFQMTELSEEEQLRLAIQNSLMETSIKSEQQQQRRHDADDKGDGDLMKNNSTSKNIKISHNRISNKTNNNNNNNNNNTKQLDNIQNQKQEPPLSSSSNIGKSGSPSELKKEKYLNEDTLTKIQLRLPINGGEKVILEWPKSTKLKIIRSHVASHYRNITKGPYKILNTFPRQNILDLDQNLTLEEAKLHPSAILHVQPEN